MAPWRGPRHRSWASNTNQATFALATIFVTWLVWEIVGEAPPSLSQLLGVSAGIWFGAVAGDKAKRDEEVEQTATRAEAKADKLAKVVKPDDEREEQR
ncbi:MULTISPECIES: hypothetical protein [unclassified Mycobacterium]|uniref:hypothetical protein n=1 Tax=unclassified Mycobacterium TaxID=2642494 RepID=UPI0029C7D70C|nr:MULTISPECIES: hypothetical protein [unclassified Mycobacterium]